MSYYGWSIVLNHSIVLAAIAGIVRVKYILKRYLPFLLFVWLALVNETVSVWLVEQHQSNDINSNIYVLCEYLILLYQFYKWGGCPAKKLSFFAGFGIAVWITDNFILHSIAENNSLFRSVYALILLFFSIDRMNSVIVFQNRNLLLNTVFLVSASFLLYYGCKLFVEIFHLYHVNFSNLFYTYVWLTLSVINCIANIVYAIAILCIPTRQELILHY